MFAISVVPKTFTRAIIKALEQSGKRDRLKLVEEQGSTDYEKRSSYAKHKNEIHPCHSLRIFALTQMQRAKVDKTIREMLVGHSTGLDKAYYKPQDEEILQEFLKAVNLLTINNEHRLQTQVAYYKQREDKLVKIDQELQKKDQHIEQLNTRYEQDFKKIKEEMNEQFVQIMKMIEQNPLLAKVKPSALEKNNTV